MTQDLDHIKDRISQAVKSRRSELQELALQIHGQPELGFNEHQAAAWLSQMLETAGFSVEVGVGGLETAFRATWEGQPGGPTIALLAEYDALPGLGHACGHNLIAAGAVGAALALKDACPDLPGRIVVLGTPAEEGGGGKILLADAGQFDGVDAAMMFHPGSRTMVLRGGLACARSTFKFYGKAAHAASSPDQGKSALDAVIHTFVAINSLRQFVRDGIRIHGIITHGGDAPNIVPEFCEARFLVRAPNLPELNEVKAMVYKAAMSSAEAVGVRCEIEEGLVYPERNNNPALAAVFQRQLELMGVEVFPPPERGGMGSSDIGRVGQETATIHPYISIAPAGTATHTREFCQASASEDGIRGMITAARAMAMTSVELCYNTGQLAAVREEYDLWRSQRGSCGEQLMG